jgi:photosystem II stability/assembly factor-like uncharacterized protein
MDAGRTWRNMGLRDTRHVGKIQIHPNDPDTVYVAALGHAFGPNEERGVFRTTDGGETWKKVLYVSEKTGCHDVAMDQNNPRTLFAAAWQTRRYPWKLDSGGPESGLWRSFDGGDSWEDVTRKPGLPEGVLGKLGVAVSPAQPGRVWALIEAEDGAVFRSDDYGEHWLRLSEQSLLRTRPWYYMHITADPQDADTVYIQNYSFWKSIDGGKSFQTIPTPHGDDHALWIDPFDNQRMIEGNDGGACVSFNGGKSWSSIYNQPTAQLYHVTTDNQFPYRVYASQQDNTALSIPNATVDGVIHERTWYAPGGGESGYIAVKPNDPNIVVASGPVGRRAYNDIMTAYDHRTGQKWNITVWPELHGWGAGAEEMRYRLGWTFPIHYSMHDPNVLYVAGNELLRSTNDGASFEAISPDLTRNDPEKLKPSGGAITRDNTGAEVYCEIFALAESPFRADLLWAGSDDGLVHISDDGGKNWRNVTPQDLPEWALISILDASTFDEGTCYLAATRYKLDDTAPYLYKTNDYGASWTKITNGIPDGEFTRVIRADPNRRGLLYAGTETGIYVSFDDGGSWERLGGLPVVPVHDFVVKDNELVVATHGRSIWILDDLTPFHQLSDELQARKLHLFTPRPRRRMRVFGRTYPRGEPNREAVNFGRVDTSLVTYDPVLTDDGGVDLKLLDAGENPPNGVVISWYQAEPSEDVTLTILDEHGNELRSFDDLKSKAGVNRHLWNMRLPGVPDVTTDLTTWDRPDGPLSLAGSYQARLSVDGETQTQPFVIEPDPRIETGAADLQDQFEFLQQVLAKLAQTNATIDAVAELRAQAAHWEQRGKADGAESVVNEAQAVQEQCDAILPKLIDVYIHQSQLWPSGLHEKWNALFESADSADKAPPQQARDVYGKLSDDLQACVDAYEHLSGETIVALNAAIARAGLPFVGAAGMAVEV